MPMIFAFDHQHEPGDVCSIVHCEHARRAPALVGGNVMNDIMLVILRPSTAEAYLAQSMPDGWILPPLERGCDWFYEVETD